MNEQHSIAEARSNLPELIRRAESGEAVELTRRGRGVAVLLGRKQYERLVSKSMRFSEAWDAFVRNTTPVDIEPDSDDAFADVRDKSPGRDIRL